MKYQAIFNLNTIFLSVLLSASAYAQENGMNYGNGATQIDTITKETITSMPSTPTPTPADDAKITATLKKMIANSPMVSKTNLDIKTEKGIVIINGAVDSDSQASTVVQFAESIIGVSDVDTSNLKVKEGTQPFTDMMITAKIKGLFIREELFGEKDLAAINTSVETKDGVVYLTGTIDNQQQIDNAIDIIRKSVPEVKKVEYSLKKVEVKPANNMNDTNNTNGSY